MIQVYQLYLVDSYLAETKLSIPGTYSRPK